MRTAVTALFSVCTITTVRANFFDDLAGKMQEIVQNEVNTLVDQEINKGKDSLVNTAKDIVMDQVRDVIRDINKGQETAAGAFMNGVSENIVESIA